MKKILVKCVECGKEILRQPPSKKRKTSYSCPQCRSVVLSKITSLNKEKEYNSFIERWKNGEESGMRGKTGISGHIRKYLFIRSNSKCELCGWGEKNKTTQKVPLEINHINGNFMDNQENNLELICPNCHSLTNSYRSLNTGKGRPRKL